MKRFLQQVGRLALVPLLAAALIAPMPGSAASSTGPTVSFHFPFGKTAQAGVAVLGSRYVYAGTATGNILHLLDVRTMRRVATWHLPSLGSTTYGMERLALSPDNRRLYILNTVREDVIVVDVSGGTAPRRWNLHGTLPLDAKVSRDGKRLYEIDGAGVDVLNATTGQHLAQIAGVSEVAPAIGGGVYTITIDRGHAAVRYVSAAGKGRTLLAWNGNSLTDRNGDIALSADGRIIYALWDSFREIDAHSGRLLRSIPLPLVPHFRWIALAPNDQQAMLTAPSFVGLYDTPGLNPGYVTRHYGFIAGGVLPVDLVHMQPLKAHLERLTWPHQLEYSSDSRWAFVSLLHEVDAVQTGTAGVDRAQVPRVALRLGGSNPGKGGAITCTVSGAWTFKMASGVGGPGNGAAVLRQTGAAVTGTLTTDSGLTWSMQGTLHNRGLILVLSAQGQIDLSYTGVLSADGKKIVGNLGTFANGHAQCR